MNPRHHKKIISVITGYGKVNVVTADSDFFPNPSWQIQLLRQNHVQAVSMDGAPVAKLRFTITYNWKTYQLGCNVKEQPNTI